MPGTGEMRRVILIKICLAVLVAGLCSSLPAVEGFDVGSPPGISPRQAAATPALAAQWSPRKFPSNSEAPRPPKKSGYSEPGYYGLLKFMAGGLLGGLLCSLLFGAPFSLYWSQGNWPLGFLDVVAISTVAYLGYRLLRPVRPRGDGIPIPGFPMPLSVAPPVFTIKYEAGPGLAQFSHADPAFNLAAFVEYGRQMIFQLHDAWNREDLDRVRERVTPQMLEFLRMGLKLLSLRGEVSRVEDLALSQIVVAMAGQKDGWERIAVNFQGRVVDYLLERRSFKLVSGSMTYPERLNECWIFERRTGRGDWLLADIQDSRFFWENEAA